jgi:hypothetical protein
VELGFGVVPACLEFQTLVAARLPGAQGLGDGALEALLPLVIGRSWS